MEKVEITEELLNEFKKWISYIAVEDRNDASLAWQNFMKEVYNKDVEAEYVISHEKYEEIPSMEDNCRRCVFWNGNICTSVENHKDDENIGVGVYCDQYLKKTN